MLLFILSHIQQKYRLIAFRFVLIVFSSLSEALKNVFQKNRQNFEVVILVLDNWCVHAVERIWSLSTNLSTPAGTWVKRFLCFLNHFLIHQGLKYAVLLVVILLWGRWNKISVSEHAKYRYCVTGNFVDKSLVVSGLMIHLKYKMAFAMAPFYSFAA